jgi:hypothetical protein
MASDYRRFELRTLGHAQASDASARGCFKISGLLNYKTKSSPPGG